MVSHPLKRAYERLVDEPRSDDVYVFACFEQLERGDGMRMRDAGCLPLMLIEWQSTAAAGCMQGNGNG